MSEFHSVPADRSRLTTPNPLLTARLGADLPECLDGYRIGMLSDVHAGPMIGLRGVRKHVEALNEGKPDLILLAGDMADGPDGQVGGALEPIYNMEVSERAFLEGDNR